MQIDVTSMGLIHELFDVHSQCAQARSSRSFSSTSSPNIALGYAHLKSNACLQRSERVRKLAKRLDVRSLEVLLYRDFFDLVLMRKAAPLAAELPRERSSSPKQRCHGRCREFLVTTFYVQTIT